MFNQSFPFRHINDHSYQCDNYVSRWHNYSFRGKNGKRYIVIAEQFEHDIYAVKFYLQEHKSCEHKYNRLSGENECSRVLTTVGEIIKDVLVKNPYSSFMFLGSPLESESKKNTKRFRLYARIVSNFIAPLDFEHKTSKNNSAYLLLNRHNTTENLLDKIIEIFRKIQGTEIQF